MTRIARLLALSLALAITALAAASSAQAAAISEGSLRWGIRESFRNYVVGGIAKGSISVSGGATQAANNGAFTFPLREGSYDGDSGETLARFDGSVRFLGHGGELDLTVSNLRIELLDSGSSIVADVSTTSFPSTGPPQTYEDVPLVALDLSANTPTVAGGRTTWTALPAALTAVGAPLFGGFYQPGAVFDPATLDYAGDGGKPKSEGFTKPGTVGFKQVAQRSPGSVNKMIRDEAHGVIHAVGSDGVRAYDSKTLEPLGELLVDRAAGEGLSQFASFGASAYDEETGTIFAWRIRDFDGDGIQDDDDFDDVPDEPGNVRAFTWDDTTKTYTAEDLDLPTARTMAWDPANDSLYSISSTGLGGSVADPAVRVATRSGGAWTVKSYPALATSGRNVALLTTSTTGAIVGTFHATAAGPQSAFVLKDTGSSLVTTDIPGTQLPKAGTGYTFGYLEPVAGPAGAVFLREAQGNQAAARVLRLEPSSNSAGYEAKGSPESIPSLQAIAAGSDGSLYTADGTGVGLRRAGAEVGRFATPGIQVVADGDGVLVFNGNANLLARWDQTGVSPGVTQGPADQRVELATAGESRSVTFTASSAGGTPAPTVKWQRRDAGQGGWTDVPDATSGSLQVNASPAQSGTRYRAVFENAAGKIATAPAALVVSVRPAVAGPLPLPPQGTPPGAPAPTRTVAPRARAAALRSSSLRVSKGRIALSIRGTGVKSRASITVRTRARYKVGKKRRVVTVATGSATLAASGSTTVRLRLTRAGRALLKKRRSIVVVVKIAPRGGPATTRTVRLRG